MTFVKSYRIMGALALTGLASACATYQYRGSSTRSPGQAPGVVVSFELVPDGAGGCKKVTPPDAAFAQGGQDVTWRITNKCDRAVTVTIQNVKEKHTTFGGMYPFKPGTIAMNIPNDAQPHDLKATVLATAEVPKDKKGFHVYTYNIRVRPGRDQDPEIIIEWP